MSDEKKRIDEGLIKKGGLNERPTTPRPPNPPAPMRPDPSIPRPGIQTPPSAFVEDPAPIRPHDEYQGPDKACWCKKFHPTTPDQLAFFVKEGRFQEIDLTGFVRANAGPTKPYCCICGTANKIGQTCSDECADIWRLTQLEPLEGQASDFLARVAETAVLSRRVVRYLIGETRRLKDEDRKRAAGDEMIEVSLDLSDPPSKKEIESLDSSLGEFSIDRISDEIEAGTSGCAGAGVSLRTDYLRWMVWATRQCALLSTAYKVARLRRREAEEKLEHNKCHSGHETLPLKLWDCPECHNETKAKAKNAEEKLSLISISKQEGKYWLHLKTLQGRSGSVCLGDTHGPIVESVLIWWCEATGNTEAKVAGE